MIRLIIPIAQNWSHHSLPISSQTCSGREYITFVQTKVTQNHTAIPIPVLRGRYDERQTITRVGEGLEKLASSHVASGNVYDIGKWYGVSSMVKYRCSVSFPTFTPRCASKRNENVGRCKNLYINVESSLAHIAKKWKQPKSPSNEGWIQKMCYIHIKGNDSAMKKNEVLTQATAWLNLENATLSERSQSQRTTYCRTPFLWNIHHRQIYRDRK